MMERSVWPWMLIVAALLPWVERAAFAAQSPATETETKDPSPRAQGAPVPASTVSPAIARFMKRSGLDLPELAVPAVHATARGHGSLPSPIPPSTSSAAVNSRVGQAVRDLPPALPSQGPSTRAPTVSDSATMRPSPLSGSAELKPAPIGPNEVRFPINLATALRLSDARPLIVAAAQASVWVAEADLTQAKVLWIPTLNVSADYLRHDGGGPDFNKGVMTAPSVNFFYGGAALYGIISTTDVIYQPLVARQVLNARQWDVQSAKNDAVLRTADAYFQVHQYRGMYAGSLYCVERGRDLVDRIATLSRDLAQPFEVDRARNMLADLEQRAVSARQQWRVQSANLTEVLRLDPRAVVEPLERDHVQITLIDPGRSLEELMPIALTNRPDLSSRHAMVKAADYAIRREQARIFLPTIALTGFQSPGGMLIQGGLFGLGPNSSLNQWTGRDDVSVQLTWQLEGFGIGNLARIKRQRGQQSEAIIDLRTAQDMVAADVNRALARAQSATARVLQADRSLRTGLITFNGQMEGLGQTSRFGNLLVLVNRPQQAVYALQLLYVAFEEYFATVAEYNRAQFDLFHALGYPAREITYLRPAGNIQPVDTVRPQFLPPVGNGPPPATR
ncbi:MAG: TolC family protein [Isosphaeraceae bacterium]